MAKIEQSTIRMAADFFLIMFVVDRSGSMFYGDGWKHFITGFKKIIEAICKNPLLLQQVEFAVVGFGCDKPVEVFSDFKPMGEFSLPEVPMVMSTHVYEAYAHAVALAAARSELLRNEFDRDPAANWIFNFSDFQVMAPDTQHRDAALEAKHFAIDRNISIFNFPCGNMVREEVATELSQPGRPPVPVLDKDFEEEFSKWVTRSMRMASMSQGGPLRLPRFRGIELRGN